MDIGAIIVVFDVGTSFAYSTCMARLKQVRKVLNKAVLLMIYGKFQQDQVGDVCHGGGEDCCLHSLSFSVFLHMLSSTGF